MGNTVEPAPGAIAAAIGRGAGPWRTGHAGAPRVVDRGVEPCTEELARRFTAEPELIAALLEGVAAGAAELGPIVTAARQALEQKPEYADLCYHAADAEWLSGNGAAGLALVQRALRLNPGYSAALVRCAQYHRRRGENARALAQLRRAIASGADYADVHLMLGDLWRERGEWLSARRAYRRSLELNADLPAARAGLSAVSARA
jgi:tetratricopeptide (TPR) repeat protein